MVRQRAEYRAGDSNKQGGRAGGVSPARQIVYRGYACVFRQIIEVDGDDGGNHQDKSGIADVIENPAFFQFGELKFHDWFRLLFLYVVPGLIRRSGGEHRSVLPFLL